MVREKRRYVDECTQYRAEVYERCRVEVKVSSHIFDNCMFFFSTDEINSDSLAGGSIRWQVEAFIGRFFSRWKH